MNRFEILRETLNILILSADTTVVSEQMNGASTKPPELILHLIYCFADSVSFNKCKCYIVYFAVDLFGVGGGRGGCDLRGRVTESTNRGGAGGWGTSKSSLLRLMGA